MQCAFFQIDVCNEMEMRCYAATPIQDQIRDSPLSARVGKNRNHSIQISCAFLFHDVLDVWFHDVCGKAANKLFQLFVGVVCLRRVNMHFFCGEAMGSLLCLCPGSPVP